MLLMAHQHEGIEFLISRRSGILAFEQGLGKTVVALEAFLRLRRVGESDRMVIICPNSLKRTWFSEAVRFANEETVCIIEGDRNARRKMLSRLEASVVLIGYESARNDVVGLRGLLARSRPVLVLDESHNIKNYRSLNATAARHFADLAEYRWLLTGTPITNTPADIYSQICVVSNERPLGSYPAFLARFGNQDLDNASIDLLAEAIRPYVLRKVKEDCLDLPEKSFRDVVVELPTWQRRLYDGIRTSLCKEVSGMSRKEFVAYLPTGLVRVLRLVQVASNPTLVFPAETRTPAKFSYLDEILSELIASGRKVLVWSYYVATVRGLAKRYDGLGCGALFGDVPVDERQVTVSRFQSPSDDMRILICNPGVAGAGYTLTAASHAIYETISWRFDHYAQSQDRIHRIGQCLPVTITRLLAENTIDNAIAESLQRKAHVASGVLDGAGTSLSQLLGQKKKFLEMVNTGHLPG